MSATLVKISKKLWTRITESRWTILYISFAVCQMIVSIIIEAVILRMNEDDARALTDLNNQYKSQPPVSPQFVYPNYSYPNYLAQYLSIIDGNIWFMVFEAFLTALCLSSLYFQNTIEIISIGLINICLLLFGSIQTYQSFKWLRRINLQVALDFPNDPINTPLPMNVLYAEFIQLAFLVLFVSASIFLGYKLYGEFGWNIYKKIGAGISTQLDIFLLLGFQILNLVFLYGDAAHNIHTIIVQSVFVAIVIPTVGLGLWGVRSENKRDESLLTFLDILGITLIIMSLFTAYLAFNNFEGDDKEV
ncbi:12198_t:CDS:2 [Dentiscutata erythropus]|uniref:12198_t:CDS:1 n=1 Tax=Dentiscutata erythropus TaxID=1348616 RepID=A0A9N9I5J8_9GLOM|nr:12198_t:CDS:2 [Dentiscutata erythropus]